ncbi:MAG: AbrB/MazE/SpoVT family DNA-binding domain-containing protein [Bacilli bacterium]|nr:AbrB/MazE/SpoVT family DNA-binding domain-containing protein [Bacilli bacterium]MBO6286763.1 AbrB/MazE/SpoVT family DNA-binding domain-containing protein [Bacilli bacterium]
MITDMKAKSLVAIPPQIAKKLSLRKGDLFDVTISEGNLILVPIVVRPRVEVEKMEKELAKFQAAEAKAEEEALAGDEGEEEEAAE